jgi:ankyrin repeat protein
MSEEIIKAVKSGDIESVRQLLAASEELDSIYDEGTLLTMAAHTGNLPLVSALIELGADVNVTDEKGWTPLMKSAYNPELNRGFADVAQTLIDAGADVETPISYGIRPLMLAAGYGETAVVEVLLKAGADVMARNEGGLTALMMVKQKHYVDVINLLHEAEREAGVGEGSCTSKNAPDSNVVTFLKPGAKP